MTISSAFPFESRFVDVHGSSMHYVEQGEGHPVLFVHGNPTSSYLWRNVIPHVAAGHRAIAVDLIGMGKSDKPDIAYRFEDHYRYLEGFIDALGLDQLTLVVHDWGGGLGITYARRNSERVTSLSFMECVLRPMDWSEANVMERMMFKRMRHPVKGDRMNKDKAFFLKRLLPMMTRRKLSAAEMAAYMEPYPTTESRLPVAQWPREIPIGGAPADVHRVIDENYRWMTTSKMPKLLLHAQPGMIFQKEMVAQIEAEVANVTSVSVGKGKHYIQEDAPDQIGQAISAWLKQHVTV